MQFYFCTLNVSVYVQKVFYEADLWRLGDIWGNKGVKGVLGTTYSGSFEPTEKTQKEVNEKSCSIHKSVVAWSQKNAGKAFVTAALRVELGMLQAKKRENMYWGCRWPE